MTSILDVFYKKTDTEKYPFFIFLIIIYDYRLVTDTLDMAIFLYLVFKLPMLPIAQHLIGLII